jgi:hypothetical protein
MVICFPYKIPNQAFIRILSVNFYQQSVALK